MSTKDRYKTKKSGTKKYIGNYACLGKFHKGCMSKYVSHSKLDKAFIEYISNFPTMKVSPDDIQHGDNPEKNNDLADIYTKYKSKLEGLEKKEKSIMKLYVNDNIGFDEYTKMSKLIKSDLSKTKEDVEKIEIQLDELAGTLITKEDVITNIKDNWLVLTNSEKMEFITSFVKSITVCNQGQKGNHFGKVKIEKVEFFRE